MMERVIKSLQDEIITQTVTKNKKQQNCSCRIGQGILSQSRYISFVLLANNCHKQRDRQIKFYRSYHECTVKKSDNKSSVDITRCCEETDILSRDSFL